MEHRYLKQENLGPFLEVLRRFGALHGPTVSEAGVPRFAPLEGSPLRLDYGRTLIPPKKYLIPFREEILRLERGHYRQVETVHPPLVLFGVHPCDLEGISYLDRVFLGDPPDPCYAARRSRLALVGVSCRPDDFCFCGDPPRAAPCDLFLAEQEESYLLSSGTPLGEEMIAAAGGLLVEGPPSPPPAAQFRGVPLQDPALRFSDHPLWERFARTCLSCGACSVCCPTCYCFDLREYPGFDSAQPPSFDSAQPPGFSGVRLREWDNCLFHSHGEVAGSNFRGSRLERLRYRFLHKYCGFSPLQGVVSCVGCGRCKAACPVGIDLRELFPEEAP